MSDTSQTENTGVEPRLIVETGLDRRVAEIIEPAIEQIGYRLVRVRLLALNGATLQIMCERPDGSMTVDDCEKVSTAVSPVLDVEDPIDKAYHLEVSSPGLDRPMVRKSDFERWIGHVVKCETSVLVDGRKRFRGKILAVDAEGFTVEREQSGEGEAPGAVIPFAALAEAKLVMTDELIREALVADKKAKAALAANQNGDADEGEDE